MWLSLTGISKRRFGLSAEMFRPQNKKRSHRRAWDLSSMFINFRSISDYKTASSHQDNWRKNLLEMIATSNNSIPVVTSGDIRANLCTITRQIESFQEKLTKLQQLKEELLNELKSMNRNEEFVESWLSQEFPWSEEVNLKLSETFGITTLKPIQLQTINATLSNKDSLVVMATGDGKSLCYQLPAIVTKGITLVISPLLSLMEDQVLSMKKLGVYAELLNSTSDIETVFKVHDELESNVTNLKLLYITPEKLARSNKFLTQVYKCYENGNLSRIVIDEVHCVTQWGNGFRPDYKIVSSLKQLFPNVPILGLTGTCTEQGLNEVKEMLAIPEALMFRSGLSRSNLFYEVRTKSNKHEQVVEDMVATINNHFSGKSGIIYCLSRRNCEVVCQDLKRHGIKCAVYHSQVSADDKNSVHQKWLDNDIQVICATSAFGMGINKPDVRFVIHHCMSKSLDVYYQECGRAGRDGLPALCLLYHGFSDIARVNALVFQEQHGLKSFANMVSYCHNTKRCRHLTVMKHFGEEGDCCNKMCDLCNGFYKFNVRDVTSSARVVMEVVQSSMSKDQRITGVQLVDTCQKKPRNKMSKLELHRVITHMLFSGYIRQEFHPSYKTITYIRPGQKSQNLERDKVLVNFPVATQRRDRVYKAMMAKVNDISSRAAHGKESY